MFVNFIGGRTRFVGILIGLRVIKGFRGWMGFGKNFGGDEGGIGIKLVVGV